MTLPFGTGDSQEVFKYSLFLVSCNRLVAACIAAATLLVSLDSFTGRATLDTPCMQRQRALQTGV